MPCGMAGRCPGWSALPPANSVIAKAHPVSGSERSQEGRCPGHNPCPASATKTAGPLGELLLMPTLRRWWCEHENIACSDQLLLGRAVLSFVLEGPGGCGLRSIYAQLSGTSSCPFVSARTALHAAGHHVSRLGARRLDERLVRSARAALRHTHRRSTRKRPLRPPIRCPIPSRRRR